MSGQQKNGQVSGDEYSDLWRRERQGFFVVGGKGHAVEERL